ncbi:MAG: tetratricopeptide repeat protein [Pseudomonadota bacterium]
MIKRFILALTVLSSPAAAQTAITTFGATEAGACYENAQNALSEDTAPCDDALRKKSTTRVDRKKTLVNRAIILNRRGDVGEALADIASALEIDLSFAEAYLNRGNSYFLLKRYDEAFADYERALSLNVSEPWAAWYNIGLVHDARNETRNAQEAYRKALALKPDFQLALAKLSDEN